MVAKPDQLPRAAEWSQGVEEVDERALARVDERELARGILGLLLNEGYQRPWTIAELKREFGEPLVVLDAVAYLQRAGLLNRHEEMVWASRAAVVGYEVEPC